MGLLTWSGLPYVTRCLMNRIGSEQCALWVADAHAQLHLVAREGFESLPDNPDPNSCATVVRTPADPAVPAVAMLAVEGGPPREQVQELLDEARETLATAAVLEESQARMTMVEGMLEAVGEQAAVIDAEGIVVRANSAWQAAPADHCDVLDRSPVGTDYLAALRAQTSRASRIAAEGIHAILIGALPSFQSDYDTDVDTGDRSYTLHVDPLPTGGAIVRHVDISFRKHLQRELAHRATHDPLTGLPNRMVMMDRLGQALVRASRTGSNVALLFCDVDRFKQINDTKGHAVGDQVLAAVARRLQRNVRQSDVVSRFGGDEFVVLLDGIGEPGNATRKAIQLQEQATQPIVVDGEELDFGLSVGVAVHSGAADPHGAALDALLAQADSAMYSAKQVGGGAIRLADAA